jgi:hypothetical protein
MKAWSGDDDQAVSAGPPGRRRGDRQPSAVKARRTRAPAQCKPLPQAASPARPPPRSTASASTITQRGDQPQQQHCPRPGQAPAQPGHAPGRPALARASLPPTRRAGSGPPDRPDLLARRHLSASCQPGESRQGRGQLRVRAGAPAPNRVQSLPVGRSQQGFVALRMATWSCTVTRARLSGSASASAQFANDLSDASILSSRRVIFRGQATRE